MKLYVRIRGRSQGPFDLEKLQAMVQQGRLTRVNQVSEDGQVWKKAGEYAELFKSRFRESATNQQNSGESGQAASQPVIDNEEGWHYSNGDKSEGPIKLSTLKQLFSMRTCNRETLIWHESEVDWKPAHELSAKLGLPLGGGDQSDPLGQSSAANPLAATQVHNTPINVYASSPAAKSVDEGEKKGAGFAIASMILGIIGICLAPPFFCCGILALGFEWLPIILGLLATIFGAVGIAKCNKGTARGKGMAVTGLVTGILAIVIATTVIALYFVYGAALITEFDLSQY